MLYYPHHLEPKEGGMMSDYDQMKLAKQIHQEQVRKAEIRRKRNASSVPVERRAAARPAAGCPERAAC